MRRILLLILACVLLIGCSSVVGEPVGEARFHVGFACEPIPLVELGECYIAGYHNGVKPEGVLDIPSCRAIWLDDGSESTVIIAVDCVGLDGGTVAEIRERLADFSRESGCDQINVVSTHTHAGVDTLGLWGEVGINGKNAEYIENLINTAVGCAAAAWQSRLPGTLGSGSIATEGMQSDSRDPQVFETKLYGLHFVPDNGEAGIRILSFAAHAESLRGDNRMISRDYPGMLCDIITERTGDNVLFLPGAIGGLVMTPEFSADRPENLRITAERLAEYALKLEHKPLSPRLDISRVEFETELDNTLFIYYKFLGILGTEIHRDLSGRYMLKSELSLIRLGELTLALIPGEIFPELVLGDSLGESDPPSLSELAKEEGLGEPVVIGLANDELGYIVRPGDWLLHEKYPYVERAEGRHYEETNSVGIDCARAIADAFRLAADRLDSGV